MNAGQRCLALYALGICALGCQSSPPALRIIAPPALAETMQTYTELLPPQLGAVFVAADDPIAALAQAAPSPTQIGVTIDDALCEECFTLQSTANGYVASGGGLLGAQYGASALLEAMGVRFYHPHYTFVPAALTAPPASAFGHTQAPAIARRGLHLHILHPIEAYFDLWEPSPDHAANAYRTIDWLVKNRANFVTWPALDNLQAASAEATTPLVAHQRAILDYAHLRGMRVGVGLQLFGKSNLQRAYDLVEVNDDPSESIARHLANVAQLPFDSIQLSFGEFSATTPEEFIGALEQAYDQLLLRFPSADVTATVHVGNFASTHVTYEEQDLIYYFLVQYANRPIIPWVHTVMYYGLFGDAGGAYNHEEFSEHRAFLLSRLAANESVGYHPETAYWVAFDNSIPMYLPVYIRNRLHDLVEIAEAVAGGGGVEGDGGAGLQDHVVFSSGWEWGYWQHDWAALRMSWQVPASALALMQDLWSPLGAAGTQAADLVVTLMDAQQQALIDERLAPYLASDDATFSAGYASGVWSQPRRPGLADVAALPMQELSVFRAEIVDRLGAFAADTAQLAAAAAQLAEEAGQGRPLLQELADGMAITATRAAFAHELWRAAAFADEPTTRDTALARADEALAEAHVIVARRHAALLTPQSSDILANRANTALLYQYGYLREAASLCYWRRERAQLRNALLGEQTPIPACVL